LIGEIEEKKTGVFMKTYDHLSSKFKDIYSNISTKGEASLLLENTEKPLEGGVDINVKLNGNKKLDIRSLSGGEKTLAALAFIFAIQEYNPASFYLLDEVDAALDKHNSEKLSGLIANYSGAAQYIVISHNDAIITEADQIYGISMNEGITKVTSLKI
jgi:chromosome segregation protein